MFSTFMRTIVFWKFCIVLFAFSCSVQIPTTSQAQFAVVRRNLKECFEIEQFRFYYDLDGPHAVKKADDNENGIPDQVEDVAKQVWVSHQVFVKTLGFPDPLGSERYAEAEFVDIHFLSKATLNSGPTTQRVGTAYDGLQKFKRNGEDDNTRSLCIDLSTVINADRNISPSHEYFHLIQNGATYFKTRWYTEGMARWSEHGLNIDRLGSVKYRGPWPQSPEDREVLFGIAYDAEFTFWNPLARLDDPKGAMDPELFGSAVRNQRYASGKRVLRDFGFSGAEFMRDVLIELGKVDEFAFKELGYKKWSEDNQKSIKNSPYIYKAVMDVARRRGHEIGEFEIRRNGNRGRDSGESDTPDN